MKEIIRKYWFVPLVIGLFIFMYFVYSDTWHGHTVFEIKEKGGCIVATHDTSGFWSSMEIYFDDGYLIEVKGIYEFELGNYYRIEYKDFELGLSEIISINGDKN